MAVFKHIQLIITVQELKLNTVPEGKVGQHALDYIKGMCIDNKSKYRHEKKEYSIVLPLCHWHNPCDPVTSVSIEHAFNNITGVRVFTSACVQRASSPVSRGSRSLE